MQTSYQPKKYVLLACLFIGPLFQLIGDSLWLTHNYNYSWSIWREACYIFFIPVGFLLAKLLEKKSVTWAIVCCALFIIGCSGGIGMMPLFRLGGFYPIGSLCISYHYTICSWREDICSNIISTGIMFSC